MAEEIVKLKSLYQELDKLASSGEDVVADLRKEINNLELTYLKESVFPEIANLLGSRIKDLRCGIDCSVQYSVDAQINYSFCTTGSMVLVKDTVNAKECEASSSARNVAPKPIVEKDSEHEPTFIATKHTDIRIVDYSEKAFAVYGDTQQFANEFKDLGGYLNPRLRDGEGWVFSKRKKPEIQELLTPFMSKSQPKSEQTNLFAQAGVEVSTGISEDSWIKMITSMKCMPYQGFVAPHKAVFMLTIIEAIKLGYIREKRIFPTTTLSECFMRLWIKNVPSDWPFKPNAFQPFIHMSGEPFYHLEKAEGVTYFDVNQNWTRGQVVKYVEYAYFDPQLFKLLHNKSFTDRLTDALIQKYLVQKVEPTIRKGSNQKPISNPSAFLDFKRYLATQTSNIGRPYSNSSISVYASALRSKYMLAKLSKFANTDYLETIADLSVIDKILYEVRYEADHKLTTNSNLQALKLFREYRRLHPLTSSPRTSTPVVPKSSKPKPMPEKAPTGKPIGIKSIDVEHIHIDTGDFKEKFVSFLNQVGPELVYMMNINYMGANLIDTRENPFFVDSCIKLDGNYWVNVSHRPQTIVNQIQKICEELGMEPTITLKHEDLASGIEVKSNSRAMFSLNGSKPLNKRRTVLETIRLYMQEHPKATFYQIEEVFPRDLQGSYGVVTKLSTIHSRIHHGYDDDKRYYLDRDKIFRSYDGIEFAVCHQWGHRFVYFQEYVKKTFNWNIEEV